MPVYRVTDPITGKTLKLSGDSAPTEQELTEIFGQYKPIKEQKIPWYGDQTPPEVGSGKALPTFAKGVAAVAAGIPSTIAGGLAAAPVVPFGLEKAEKVLGKVGGYVPSKIIGKDKGAEEFAGNLGQALMMPFTAASKIGGYIGEKGEELAAKYPHYAKAAESIPIVGIAATLAKEKTLAPTLATAAEAGAMLGLPKGFEIIKQKTAGAKTFIAGMEEARGLKPRTAVEQLPEKTIGEGKFKEIKEEIKPIETQKPSEPDAIMAEKEVNRTKLTELISQNQINPNHIIRGTTLDWLNQTKDLTLPLGKSAEGYSVISATQVVPGAEIPMYGGKNHILMVAKKNVVEGKGQGVNEVFINPNAKKTDFAYIYKGKTYSYENLMKEVGKKQEAQPKVETPTPKEPVEVKAQAGVELAIRDESGKVYIPTKGETTHIAIVEKNNLNLDKIQSGYVDKNGKFTTEMSDAYISKVESALKQQSKEEKQAHLDAEADAYERVRNKAQEGAGEPKVTGVKNAIVDAERATEGRPPIDREGFSEPRSYEEVKALVEKGEVNPQLIAEDVIKTSRPLTTEETRAFEYHRAKQRNDYNELQTKIEQAQKNGDVIAEAELQAKRAILDAEINTVDTAVQKGGTEAGRSFRERQNLIDAEDYSLATMIRNATIDNGGKPLPENIRQKYVEISKKLEEAQKKLQEYEEGQSQRAAEKTVIQMKNEIAKETRQAGRRIQKENLKAEFDTLVENFAKKYSSRLGAGIDPMMAKDIAQIAKNRVRSGQVSIEMLVDELHTAFKNYGLELNKRDIRDAISGYGITRQLSRDEINVRLREIKRQGRLISELEDAQVGQAKFKSQYGRDVKSPRVLELEAKLKKAQQEHGIDTKRLTDEQALGMLKTRTRNKALEYEDRLKRGDFADKHRREIKPDKELIDLRFRVDQAKRAYHENKISDQLARLSTLQKMGYGVGETAGIVRALKSSFDISAPLRQGLIHAVSHPIMSAKVFPDMIRALKSEQGRFLAEQKILQDPLYSTAQKNGLALTEHGQKLSKMEEIYASRLVDKIPGISHSARAYSTYLNRLRMEAFKQMYGGLIKKGDFSTKGAEAIVKYINEATGRGALGVKDSTLVGLNNIFFAPRLVLSRFQILTGHSMWGGTRASRTLIAKEYGRFLAGVATIYGIAEMAGLDVGYDPKSSNFGKIKVGNTRIDPLAGLSQAFVYGTRTVTGEKTTLSGKTVPIRGEGITYGRDDWTDITKQFLRSKLAPAPGIAVDLYTGENVVGEKTHTPEYLAKMLAPLAPVDMYEAMLEHGVSEGAALGTLAMFGIGVQTYKDKTKKTKVKF